MRPNQPAITAQNIVEHCQKFFSKPETVPKVVVFGGGYSEPLDSLPTVISAMEELRLSRHGLPFVVQTNGRPSDPTKTVEEIIEVDTRFRDAPGSDGDSKLSVWVNIAAHSPPAYKTAMEEDTNGGFGEVCGFISSLVEGGARVYATGVVRPGVNVKAVEQVAEAVGAKEVARLRHIAVGQEHLHALEQRLGGAVAWDAHVGTCVATVLHQPPCELGEVTRLPELEALADEVLAGLATAFGAPQEQLWEHLLPAQRAVDFAWRGCRRQEVEDVDPGPMAAMEVVLASGISGRRLCFPRFAFEDPFEVPFEAAR